MTVICGRKCIHTRCLLKKNRKFLTRLSESLKRLHTNIHIQYTEKCLKIEEHKSRSPFLGRMWFSNLVERRALLLRKSGTETITRKEKKWCFLCGRYFRNLRYEQGDLRLLMLQKKALIRGM